MAFVAVIQTSLKSTEISKSIEYPHGPSPNGKLARPMSRVKFWRFAPEGFLIIDP